MDPVAQSILEEMLASLVEEAGAITAAVVDAQGQVRAFRGLAPKSQTLMAPGRERLDAGPASALATSGERIGWVAAGWDAYLLAIFPPKVSARLAEAALEAAVGNLAPGSSPVGEGGVS
jgi:hypothetical protein